MLPVAGAKHRRAFIVGSAAAAAISAGSRHQASAEIWDKAIEWFIEVVKTFPPTARGIYRGLLSLKGHYRLLVDDRARLQNVRRELTDASDEKHLQTKLATCLAHYDAWVAEKPRPGESDADFAARRERDRLALQQEWKQLRDDAGSALKTIETIGVELDSIDPNIIPAAEGLTTKLHLRVIGNGLPVQIELSPGQMNDQPMAELLLNDLPAGADVIADKGYDADWIRDLIEDQDCTPHIPPKSNRYDGITYSKAKYKKRNLIERCFNKLKQFRHIATRYDRNALNYLAMIKIAVVRLWLRFYESAP